MDLVMFLGNEFIDSVRINEYRFHSPGYIQSLKIEMEDKNEDIIDLSEEEPQFFIETVPSVMNTSRNLLKQIN